jgi:myosin heavy subunit
VVGVVVVTEEDRERLHAHIPTDLKERMRQDASSQTDVVIEALELYFGQAASGNEEALRRQLSRWKEQKARGEQMVQSGREMVEEAERGIENINRRLESMQEHSREYDAALDEELARMQEERRPIFEGVARLEELSGEFSKPESEILADLKARSDLGEQWFTPGVPEQETRMPWEADAQ